MSRDDPSGTSDTVLLTAPIYRTIGFSGREVTGVEPVGVGRVADGPAANR